MSEIRDLALASGREKARKRGENFVADHRGLVYPLMHHRNPF
jgi:hypothetical protein